MTSPRVSIITRTKDRPTFLKRAMRSVLEQNYPDWIHVIVNDGGDPAAVDLLVSMEKESYAGRVKVIHHEESKGMQNASNAGLNAVESTYAVIHDDDDSWRTDFIEVCVDYLEKEGPESMTQGVVTQTTQILEELCVTGEIQRIRELPYYPFTHVGLKEMRERNMFAPIAFLYRRAAHDKIGYFRQEFDVLGDHDFNLRFLRQYEIGVISTFHANYHWRHGSQGNTVTRARNVHREMLTRMQNVYSRELLDNPGKAVGDIGSIEMPPPDGPEVAPFNKRTTEPVELLPVPDFLNEYDFDVLSLDIFDTVLKRRCHRPVDVFALLEERSKQDLDLPRLPIALARREAEQKARGANGTEVRLGEIYDVLKSHCHLDQAQTDALMELELDIEKELLYADPRWVKLYADFTKAGVRIIFVSDMYLDSETIAGLLAVNGFPNAEVHVSCEYNCNKHRGRLQPEIVKKIGVDPERILHIGDNFQSDCIRTWQAGWQAMHWSQDYNYTPWFAQLDPYYRNESDLLSTRIMGEVERLGIDVERPADCLLDKLGREAAGPFYLSFLLWVLNEAKKDNIRKLILLGRDGYYWEKALEVLTEYQEPGVESVFLHSSRKVLNFASFRSLDEEAIEFLLTPNPALTVRDFVGRTGIDPYVHLEQIKQAGFTNPDEVLTTPMGGKFLKAAFSEKLRYLFLLLKPQLEEQFAGDRDGVLSLLQEAGFDSSDCAVVDIGWNASCAQSLSRLFELEKPNCLKGYFFGTWEKAKEGKWPVLLKSYFVHLGMPLENADLIRESVNWIESLNAAPFPTLVAFGKVDGVTQPQFSDVLKGGFSVEQQAAIWKGAERFLRAIGELLPRDPGRCPGYNYLQLVLRRLLREPTLEEVNTWGDILHSEGYGIVSHTPLIRRIDEETVGKDLMRAYWASNWRKGFLTTLSEEKCQFILERARPGRVRTVEELETDLKWRQRQVDAFWNEKEGYKEEIAELRSANAELNRKLEALKTDLDWKSGEAHALLREKEVLQEKLDAVEKQSQQPESN